MSAMGSAPSRTEGSEAAVRDGSRKWTDWRVLVAGLTLLVALSVAATDISGYGQAWTYLTSGQDRPALSVSTDEVFDELQPTFRDYSTASRDIYLMEERAKIDARYLDTVARLLERTGELTAESGGVAPVLEAFADLRAVLDLETSCTAGNPWSAPVSTVRREIDTAADGSKRVALDLLLCLFTVPKGESGIVRYPIATVTLSGEESRHLTSLYANITGDDARKALQWLQAVMSGEVAHLQRLQEIRHDATATLSAEINGSLYQYLRSNQAAFEQNVWLVVARSALLLGLVGLAVAMLVLGPRRPGPRS